MALLQTMWMKRIMDNLFDDISFLTNGQNWDEYVVAGAKTVVIPQAGAPAGYERNRTVFPATAGQRTDSDIEFTMVDYTSNPQHILDLDQLQMSYDKMSSVLNNMLLNIKDGVALDMLYNWRPEAGNIIATTGAAAVSGLTGTTGNRKKMTFVDVVNAGKALDKMLTPKAGRILMVSADQHADLLTDPDVKDKFNQSLANLNTGVLGTLAGFTVKSRASVLAVSTADVVRTATAAIQATDSEMALAWHPSFVGRSIGNINVYENQKDPLYYGNIISSQIQAGGKKTYTNGRGVIGIKAAPTA